MEKKFEKMRNFARLSNTDICDLKGSVVCTSLEQCAEVHVEMIQLRCYLH